MNNTERELWIDNDEGLYRWWRSERLSKRAFIRAHRTEIDAVIDAIVTGKHRAHYLVYGD